MMETNEEVIQRAILVGLYQGLKLELPIEESMVELEELTKAAGGVVVGVMIQNKDKIEAATYIGTGKVDEVRLAVESNSANVVIFNDELSGAQIRNLEGLIGVKVVDRTALILDIFALRAQTKIAKLQVELAQLRYRLPRLKGYGGELSRQGGGIGTRGPGEQKLEMDRRKITERMDDIRSQIKDAQKNRVVQRQQREKSEIPIVALVGYTNAGKSSVMNQMLKWTNEGEEGKAVFEKDMLFATLDTFSRRIELSDKKAFVLTDTVGFVSKLPHSLVEAFKATLEEAVMADLLVHVVDASNPNHLMQMHVTQQVLKDLNALSIPMITLYNKIDLCSQMPLVSDKDAIKVSAKFGTHFDSFVQAIKASIFNTHKKGVFLIPYHDGKALSYLCETYKVEQLEYLEAGTQIVLEVEIKDYNKYHSYLSDSYAKPEL